MKREIDIFENDILTKYSEVLQILLCDRTTGKNIFWATDNYEHLGDSYKFYDQMIVESITGHNGHIIMPRVKKNKELQQTRVKSKAEVFTPSWVCNSQNNLIDTAWFGREKVFNAETVSNENKAWKASTEKISFPEGKNYKDYINDIRLEVACGEAPYLASRYDITTGEFIPVKDRIGLLDRKLRIINENLEKPEEWLQASQSAYKSIYAFEWQGDSLLLAREALLYTFVENYILKFDKEPPLESIQGIANIISWNIWQMDGLKGVIPNSCKTNTVVKETIFGENETINKECSGCINNNIHKHNGLYAMIKDWGNIDPETGKEGRIINFVKLLNK